MEPLKGKGALLGEKKTLSFCDVATGKGLKAGSCFAVSKEGILCEFNGKRNLTKWVDLTVSPLMQKLDYDNHEYVYKLT